MNQLGIQPVRKLQRQQKSCRKIKKLISLALEQCIGCKFTQFQLGKFVAQNCCH